MAKRLFSINEKLMDENERLLNDLNLCHKRIEFLENYRKVFNQFNKNCICDQNKITTYLFLSLERQYKQKTIPQNVFKGEPKTKIDRSVGNASQKKRLKKVTKKQKNIQKLKPNEEMIISGKPMESILQHFEKPSNEMSNEIIQISSEEVSNRQPVEESGSRDEPIVQIVVTTPSPEKTANKSIVLKSTEEDSDLTFPSFNDPIFSMKANYVEELAAQVVPKINDSVTQTKSQNVDTISTQISIPVTKIQRKTSGRPLRLTTDKQISDQMSDNSNLKLMILLEDLKNGRLKSFNDPNNDMISVFLKIFDSYDGKKVTKIVYKCNYSLCGFETISQQYIHRHIDRHKTSNRFRSSLMKYRTFTQLLDQLKSGELQSFIDPDYDSVLVTLRPTDSNEEPNHSELIYKCLYTNCQFETYGKYYIRSHILRHNKNKTFACSVCKEEFTSNVSRVEHQINVHNEYKNPLYECEFPDCSYKTTVRQSMEFHKIKHKSEKTIKCEKIGCDLYFKGLYQMKNHMKRVHVLKTVVCEWPGCEAKFKTKYDIQHHMRCHTGQRITVGRIRDILKEGNYVSTVDKNNKLFSVIRQQIIDENNGKTEIGPKLGFKCNSSECKFVCITSNLISEHTLSHSMGKAFECDLCHKTYTLRNHLNNHKKLVHNINNKCPLLECAVLHCDYSTRNPYCFRQHEKSHRTDTPFQCSENGCQKSFKTNMSLKQHINNSHMNVSLLACSWPSCKASFKSKSHLNYHLKSHSKPKKTFECNHCSKTFNFKTNLTKHLKSQHSFD